MPRHSPSKGGKDNCATDRRTIKASASNTCRLTDTANMALTLKPIQFAKLATCLRPHEDTRSDSEHNSTLRHMFIHFSCHIHQKKHASARHTLLPCFTTVTAISGIVDASTFLLHHVHRQGCYLRYNYSKHSTHSGLHFALVSHLLARQRTTARRCRQDWWYENMSA